MNLMLRTKRLIGPFWSQLVLLAVGLLLTASTAAAGPVYTIGQECDPRAFATTWSQATSAGPALTSVTASTDIPGTFIVRGHGFSAGSVVEIAAYDACGVDRLALGQTNATDFGVPHSGSADPAAHYLLQDGLVTWTFTLDADDPFTVRAHDVDTGARTNVVLVDGPTVDRAQCDRDCHRWRGVEPTP